MKIFYMPFYHTLYSNFPENKNGIVFDLMD